MPKTKSLFKKKNQVLIFATKSIKKMMCYVVVWNSKQLDNNAAYLSE